MSTKPVTGIKIAKGGKIKRVHKYRDASAAIRAKKSQKQRPIRRTV
jgi:hypothetical protein